MWARGPGWEGGVEVEIELGIKDQIILHDVGHMDLVIAFGVDLAEVIFVQEVIADHQALLIFGERDVMWTGARAEIERPQQARLVPDRKCRTSQSFPPGSWRQTGGGRTRTRSSLLKMSAH